jgi:CBS domain-containing protein
VREFLSPQWAPIGLHPDDSLETVLGQLSTIPYAVSPVTDMEGRLLGVVNLEEVHLASRAPALGQLILAEDLMRTDIRPLTPDDTLDRALELFVENDLMVLPVVGDLKERKVMGVVRRHQISSAYLSHMHGPRAS